MVFAWTEPGAELVLYHRGYVRRSVFDYPEDEIQLKASDLSKNGLTNNSEMVINYRFVIFYSSNY